MIQRRFQALWQPSNWYLAEVTHVLFSVAIVEYILYHWNSSLDALLVINLSLATMTAIKEFIIDLSPFEGDTVYGSAQDWSCYLLGLLVADLGQWHAWLGLLAGAVVIGGLFTIDVFAQHAGEYD